MSDDGFDASQFAGAIRFDDAHATLVSSLIRSNVQVGEGGVEELAFIWVEGGAWGKQFVEWFIEFKQHQSPGAMKRFVEALKAQSLYEEKTRRQTIAGDQK